MHLFMLHEARFFHDRLVPALAASARARSFEPLSELAVELAATVESFARQFHLSAEERPLFERLTNTRFDRRLWRHFAGEFLLYASVETPEVTVEPELLGQFFPMSLASRLFDGSQRVSFGSFPYGAGWHDRADVDRLAADLAAIEPATWSPTALEHVEPEDRDEELAWIRDRFDELRAMVKRAQAANCVIVCEEL